MLAGEQRCQLPLLKNRKNKKYFPLSYRLHFVTPNCGGGEPPAMGAGSILRGSCAGKLFLFGALLLKCRLGSSVQVLRAPSPFWMLPVSQSGMSMASSKPLLHIPYKYVMVITLSLPVVSLGVCVFLGTVLHLDASTRTHCKVEMNTVYSGYLILVFMDDSTCTVHCMYMYMNHQVNTLCLGPRYKDICP